jgi:hypothetical protein
MQKYTRLRSHCMLILYVPRHFTLQFCGAGRYCKSLTNYFENSRRYSHLKESRCTTGVVDSDTRGKFAAVVFDTVGAP